MTGIENAPAETRLRWMAEQLAVNESMIRQLVAVHASQQHLLGEQARRIAELESDCGGAKARCALYVRHCGGAALEA